MNESVGLESDPSIPSWGSEEAKRKEKHIERFMEREYKDLLENPVPIEDLKIRPDSGPMTEQTDDLMKVHYDQELYLFERFLDDYYMAYTMAYYGDDAETAKCSNCTIEEAQAEKFKLICNRIGISGDERVLNIGCGFGSFERYLLENYPSIEVVGVTPSKVQVDYIRRCMDDPSHVFSEGRFSIYKNTFELLGEEDIGAGEFDLVTSIGFFEAVRNLSRFNQEVARWLKPGGKAFHHAIVSKITLPQTLELENTMIGQYFPGSRVWPIDELPKHAGPLKFERSWFVNGMNYWKTLDAWHEKYWENMEDLKKCMSSESLAYWNDYFILCKGCFSPLSGEIFGNGHYLFSKP